MTGSDTGSRRPGQDPALIIPGAAFVVLMLLLVSVGLMWLVRMGVFPQAEVLRSGTAQVQSCRPAVSQLFLMQTCRAEVTWTSPEDTWVHTVPLSSDTDIRVMSSRSLEGTVEVESHAMPTLTTRSAERTREVVIPADHPSGRSGWYFVPALLVPLVVSVLATMGLQRLLQLTRRRFGWPAPPEQRGRARTEPRRR